MKRNNRMIAIIMVAMIGLFGTAGYLSLQSAGEDNVLYEWRVFVYPTDLSDVGTDIQASVMAYDASNSDYALAAEEFVETLTLCRHTYQERYVMMGEGNALMNSTLMHQWNWKIMVHNGTVDITNPENNLWNGTMYMNQHMNKNAWTGVVGETEWQYSFNYSYGDYTVEIQLAAVN